MAAYHAINGKLGGLTGGAVTLARYGRDHFSQIGKLGGRPSWQRELERDKEARLNASRRRKI